FIRIVAAALAFSTAANAQFQLTPAERAARAAATERDYYETLQRLGLGSLRAGVDGMHPDAPNAVNYDEARVRPYVLPPLLTMPQKAREPVPLVLELGFPEGFHFPGFPPPPNSRPDWTEQVAARGWGYAFLVPYTVQPDDGAGLSEGVIGIAAHRKPRASGD